MSDLIDRQKAKDAIDMALDDIEHVTPWVYDHLLNALNKVPSVKPTHPTPSNTLGALDCVDRAEVIKAVKFYETFCDPYPRVIEALEDLPSAQPERLTDDDFETIRIHLNAFKENLCNQRRWKEAEEYQRIIDRFMSFASAQPRKGKWTRHFDGNEWYWYCSSCKEQWYEEDLWMGGNSFPNFCPNCGSYNGG